MDDVPPRVITPEQLAVVRIPRSTALRDGTGTLELPALLGALPQLRDLVWELRDQIAGPGEATQWAEQLAIAVVEVFTNIVRHEGEGAGPVRCTVRHADGRITLRLSHRGSGFVPGDVPLPDVVALPTGGFGLHLIHASVDEARWEPDADGQAGVTLVTSISRTPALIPSNPDDMA